MLQIFILNWLKMAICLFFFLIFFVDGLLKFLEITITVHSFKHHRYSSYFTLSLHLVYPQFSFLFIHSIFIFVKFSFLLSRVVSSALPSNFKVPILNVWPYQAQLTFSKVIIELLLVNSSKQLIFKSVK